ncbi:MAG: thioredoxin family protein, partial [Isosphaeraceae bacterium]
MTVATLLLALLTATNPSSGGGASADPILLDFHADWCGPCQRMRPAIDQLTRKGIPIRSVNIDRSPAIAQKYGVSAVPTFVVVDRSGRELDRTSGLQPAAVLEQFYQNAAAKARPAAAAPDQDADAPAARRPVARRNDDADADA